MNASFVMGSLLAVYFLVGRWSFSRLSSGSDTHDIVQQPRFWVVLAVVVLGALVFGSRRWRVPPNLPRKFDVALLVFLLYLMLTAVWSPDHQLALTKFYEVGLVLAVSLTIVFNRESLVGEQLQDGFWKTLVLLCLAMGVMALLNGATGRLYSPTGGPNTFGRNMGLLAVGAVFLGAQRGSFYRLASIGLVALGLLLVVICGSRGGFISTSVAAAVLLVFSNARFSTKVVTAAAMAGVVLLVLFCTSAGQNALDVFRLRIVEQTINNRYLSGREDLWLDAWLLAWEKPYFGWGLNGFRSQSWTYPHNLFLEVFMETGFVGLVLLARLLWTWWSHLRQIHFRVPRENIAAVALVLTASQTSGDLFDTRGLFLLTILTVQPLVMSSIAAQKSNFPKTHVESRGPHPRLAA